MGVVCLFYHPFFCRKIPIVDSELRKQEGNEEHEEIMAKKPKGAAGPMVTADGTYVSQSALSSTNVKKRREKMLVGHNNDIIMYSRTSLLQTPLKCP